MDREQLALEFIKILLPEIHKEDYKELVVKEAFEIAEIYNKYTSDYLYRK